MTARKDDSALSSAQRAEILIRCLSIAWTQRGGHAGRDVRDSPQGHGAI